jgi:hypothetical protein
MKNGLKALIMGVAFAVTLALLSASRNSGGTYSLPSGNPVVSGTTITSSWANTTLGDLGTEMTNSLDRSGRGAMLQPLQLWSGTSVAPGLTWSAETNSGIYRAAATDFRQQVSGATVEKWTPSGVTLPLGATATQSQTNLAALIATGNGTGNGILATGGTTNGVGVVGIGGASNGVGGQFLNGTASTATVHQDALSLSNGDLNLDGTTLPNPTVGFKNRVTLKNIPKAWVLFTLNSTGSPTIVNGFNVGTVGAGGTGGTFSFATNLANNGYACSCVVSEDSGTPAIRVCSLSTYAAASITWTIYSISTAAAVSRINPGAVTGPQVSIVCTGGQ